MMHRGRLLISGGTIISMDRRIGDLECGDVFIVDGRIDEVGSNLAVGNAARIDASGCVVLPGLVDTHRHTWQSVLRHRLGDVDFAGYGCAMLRGMGPLYTAEDTYIGTLLGAVAALEAGTTTLLDWSHALNTPAHADAAVAALRNAGIRAIFAQGWSRSDGRNWTNQSTLRHPSDIIRVRRDLLADDEALVTHCMAGRGPEMTTIDVVGQDFTLARELGIRISMHAGVRDLAAKFRAVDAMGQAGLLGPDLTLIHVCACSADEFRLMQEHGVSVSIGPQAEMMIDGCGVPALGRLLAAGIRPSLSGDTETTGTGDLFTQMRLALAAERLISANKLLPDTAPPVRVRDVLEFATIEGARACGLDHRIGSLTPGKDADIIIIDGSGLNLLPITDPVGAIVLAAHPGNVDTVLVRGEPRKLRGQMVDVDRSALASNAHRSRERLLGATGIAI